MTCFIIDNKIKIWKIYQTITVLIVKIIIINFVKKLIPKFSIDTLLKNNNIKS
jgi:hypothetical protein